MKMTVLSGIGRNLKPGFMLATVLGIGITLGGAGSAMAQANDPTVPCDKTNNQWGDSEFCYIGPRTPQATAPTRNQDSASHARAQATGRNAEPGGKARRPRR